MIFYLSQWGQIKVSFFFSSLGRPFLRLHIDFRSRIKLCPSYVNLPLMDSLGLIFGSTRTISSLSCRSTKNGNHRIHRGFEQTLPLVEEHSSTRDDFFSFLPKKSIFMVSRLASGGGKQSHFCPCNNHPPEWQCRIPNLQTLMVTFHSQRNFLHNKVLLGRIIYSTYNNPGRSSWAVKTQLISRRH